MGGEDRKGEINEGAEEKWKESAVVLMVCRASKLLKCQVYHGKGILHEFPKTVMITILCLWSQTWPTLPGTLVSTAPVIFQGNLWKSIQPPPSACSGRDWNTEWPV